MVDRLEGLQHVPDGVAGAGPRRDGLRRRQAGRPRPGGRRRAARARDGAGPHRPAAQLETFTHNSSEFLRREEALLLHGQGLPAGGARLAGRPAVVVVEGKDHRAELKRISALRRASGGPS